jgi:hypothetical protein
VIASLRPTAGAGNVALYSQPWPLVILGILCATRQLAPDHLEDCVVAGELGLDGRQRAEKSPSRSAVSAASSCLRSPSARGMLFMDIVFPSTCRTVRRPPPWRPHGWIPHQRASLRSGG